MYLKVISLSRTILSCL